MKEVTISIKYKTLDLQLIISDFEVEQDGDMAILDYDIAMDYCYSSKHPHPLDAIARMIDAMLQDGDHLKEKILEVIRSDYDQWYLVENELATEWNRHWEEERENYLAAECDYYEGIAEDRKLGLMRRKERSSSHAKLATR